jgi:hypothetical protein
MLAGLGQGGGMSAQEWNNQHRIGQRVTVTLADGRTVQTRTLGPAQRWSGVDIVEVAGFRGPVLLSCLEPVLAGVA